MSATTTRVRGWLRSRRLGDVLGLILVFIIFVAIWEAAVRTLEISKILLPAPSGVAKALVRGLVRGDLIDNARVTVWESVAGFVIGALIGISIGAVVAEVRAVEKFIYPYVVAFQAIPKMAIAPLVIIWLGFGISSKIAVVATVVFFPIAVNTVEGLKSADPAQIEMLRSFGANRWKIFWMIRVPISLPFVMAGLDVAAVLAVLGSVVAEWVGAQAGLGNMILKLTYNLDVAGMFAVLIILSIMGVAAHLLVRLVQIRVVFWQREQK